MTPPPCLLGLKQMIDLIRFGKILAGLGQVNLTATTFRSSRISKRKLFSKKCYKKWEKYENIVRSFFVG